MKKIFFLFLVLFTFLLLASPALSAPATPAAIRNEEEFRKEATQGAGQGLRETVRQETRERIQEKIATIQARLNIRKKEIIRSHFGRVTQRLEAAINRLNRLISRIESRIAKIEASNPDTNTTTIKQQIAQAKEKLKQTTDQLTEAKTKMEEAIESNTPYEGFLQVKNMIDQIRKNLVEVHQILVKVIGDIKGLRVGTISTPSAITD